jgi:hypothetical protein
MSVTLSLTRIIRGGSTIGLAYGIGWPFRFALGSIALIMGIGALSAGGIGAGWLFVALPALGALYEERWLFDSQDRTVRGRMGLVFLAKGPSFSFSDVTSLDIDIFAKGQIDQRTLPAADKMPRGSQARLILHLKDGQSFMIDSVPFAARAKLRKDAQEIAALLGMELG